MSFSKALYYPSIDINDENWLKSAILFWDEINTIVPYSIQNPYSNYTTQYLSDEGIINPIRVNPDSVYVREASEDALKFVVSTEGMEMLSYSDTTFSNKESLFIRRGLIHESKMDYILGRELRRIMKLGPNKEGYYAIDYRFVNYYMTLLAKSISENKSLAVVSNNAMNNRLINTARFDKEINYSFDYSIPDITLKQGILTNCMLDNIIISETNTLKDIVDFRKHYKDELARFRTNLSKLIEPITSVPSYEALQNQITTVYTQEFLPAYHDLQKALHGSKIRWFFDNLSKLCVFSVSTTAAPMLLGLGAPQALMLSAGISIVSSVIAYNVQKQEKLRENPYTYLLNINKELCD